MRATSAPDPRPLIAHVVYRFAVGGLENGVANLVNRLPAGEFRHAIVGLTEVTEFRERIRVPDVRFFALGKRPGHGLRLYPALFSLFRRLRPAIVHTRNLAALEASAPAWAAGVPIRVHGEHGWDVADLAGTSRRYRLIRRAYRPFVGRYVAVSRHLKAYLETAIGVPGHRIAQIYNGADTDRFAPAGASREPVDGWPFRESGAWVVGTVGRMEAVKDHVGLAEAFVRARQHSPAVAARLRLVIAGDGPLKARVEGVLEAAGARADAWLPGERPDVARILRRLDCFVLPSLSEGISNTVLEAMASGLPVVATRAGGNPELIDDGQTGRLVPVGDTGALAQAILAYLADPAAARRHGQAGREAAERRFSLDRMVEDYRKLYAGLLAARGLAPAGLSVA